MNTTALKAIVPDKNFLIRRSALMVSLLLIACTATSFGQNASAPTNSSAMFSVRATHLLGFEAARNKAGGTLSIQDSALRFQTDNQQTVQVAIASIQAIFLGDESKQVGGVPMTLGKAAVPFGGGRAVSLFTHKTYDTFALEYVASDGGIHGAIFELSEGQGKLVRDHLVALGAHVSHNDEVKQRNAEVSDGSK